jgi:hypothetical protein
MRQAEIISDCWLSRLCPSGNGAALPLALFRGNVLTVQSDEPVVKDGGGGTGSDEDGDGDSGGGKWVTVATFWASEAAHIARLALESNGVRCMILDEYLVATDWLLAQATGGIKLQVQQSHLALARTILTEKLGGIPGSALNWAAAPGRADRLADWIAGQLQSASRMVWRWVGRRPQSQGDRSAAQRPSRRWWLGALLPLTLAVQALAPARGQTACRAAENPTAPVCGIAAA